MGANDAVLHSFRVFLRAEHKSPKTITSYVDSAELLATFHGGKPLLELSGQDIQAFIADQLDRWAPATAAVRFRSLQQFYRWAASDAEGLIAATPMVGLRQPSVPENPPDVLTDDQLAALIKACEGRSFTDRRDMAMVRLMLIAGGPRLSEIAEMEAADADLDRMLITVIGKGRRPRAMPFSDRTALALGRYLRERQRHQFSGMRWLWLGSKGQLTTSGITQVLRRRGARAGIKGLHPHMLRHTAAHRWKSTEGANEEDMMRLFGWRSMEMVRRYGARVADERAQAAARRLAIDDVF